MWATIQNWYKGICWKDLPLSPSSWLFFLDVVVLEKWNEICENGSLVKSPQVHKVEIDTALSKVGLDVDRRVN